MYKGHIVLNRREIIYCIRVILHCIALEAINIVLHSEQYHAAFGQYCFSPWGAMFTIARARLAYCAPHNNAVWHYSAGTHTHTCWRVIRSCDRGVNSSRDEREEERKEEFRRGEQV